MNKGIEIGIFWNQDERSKGFWRFHNCRCEECEADEQRGFGVWLFFFGIYIAFDYED